MQSQTIVTVQARPAVVAVASEFLYKRLFSVLSVLSEPACTVYASSEEDRHINYFVSADHGHRSPCGHPCAFAVRGREAAAHHERWLYGFIRSLKQAVELP